MNASLPQLQRFIFSHHFFSGVRQAVGVLALPIAFLLFFHNLHAGMVAAFGAACVAIIDQPGGPRRYGTNGMLAAILLGSLTVALTGLASSSTFAILLLVPVLCFFFSMFTVFGKQGGLLGFACLLVMTLTMRIPLAPADVLVHTTYSLMGGLFYFAFSYATHRILWHREDQQTLSVALFATADYVNARALFYDINTDMDANYRQLIRAQSAMTEAHQSARDTVLRELPRGDQRRSDRLRAASLNVFIDMVALLDTLVATQTDYATLRRRLPESDTLVFARDALRKLAANLSQIALNIARDKRIRERHSAKAELRAFEFELENFRRDGLQADEPEVYALLVQILRRLRNAARLVDRIADHVSNPEATEIVDLRLQASLNRFISRQSWRVGSLTSNLRLDSSHCRYALRVTIAASLAMMVTTLLEHAPFVRHYVPDLSSHSYWVVLTILVIMKPGFALTRQRNGFRLIGTVIGCVLALVLFHLTNNPTIYLLLLIASSVLGYSLIQVNFMISAVFNTLFVLLAFHFTAPASSFVVGERLADTVLGCVLALMASYILPWWERSFMPSLAAATQRASREMLRTGLLYAALSRRCVQARQQGASASNLCGLESEQHEAELNWRVARKNMHIAFGNFASAFYRMMDEPPRQQRNVAALNNLLLQHHALALQLASAVPILASLPAVPEGLQKSLDAVGRFLNDQDADPPVSIETEGELAALAYPVRQMVKAASLIRQEMRGLDGGLPSAGTASGSASEDLLIRG
ncbi:MAG: FUSC family protein [Alcaligenaceae bacterium]|nr:FUSC family protein [Alcaligenaceae bacterium]